MNSKKNIFIFFLFIVCIFLLLLVTRPDYLSFGTITFVFGCFSVAFSAVFFLSFVTNKLDDIDISPLDILYGGVVLTVFLSFLFLSKQRQLAYPIYTICSTFILYLLIRFSYKKYLYNKQTLLVSFLIGVAGIEAIRGLLQYFSNYQMKGIFFNVNHFSMYIALHIPLAFALIWSRKHRVHFQLLLISVTGILLLCILLSKCRTAYIAIILTLSLMFFVRNVHIIQRIFLKSPKYFLFICRGASLIMFVFMAGLFFFLRPLSAVGRILIWKVSLLMFSESPVLGVGFDNFSNLYSLYQGRFFDQGMGATIERISASHVPYAFNDYIETVVEFGVLGSIVFAIFWFFVIKNIWDAFVRVYHTRKGESERQLQIENYRKTDVQTLITENLALGMAGLVLIYMIMSFFYYPSKIIPIYVLFNVSLAYMVSENQKYSSKTPRQGKSGIFKSVETACRILNKGIPHKTRRFFFTATSCIAFLISVILLPSFYLQSKAERKWYNAQVLTREGHDNRAIELYISSYPNLKWNGRFLQDYGKLLLRTGKEADAVNYFEQGKNSWPSPFLFEDLAMAYRKTGNLKKAVENASLASSILPWRLTSKFFLADLYSKLGDFTNTVKYSQLVLDTPMKKWTREGEELKVKARIIQQNLKTAFEKPRNQKEKAILLLPAAYRLDAMKALIAAGDNARQLIEAIHTVDPEQRSALAFLLTNMPKYDLRSLTADFLATNVKYAFKVRSTAFNSTNVPEEIFFNYVLPYANVNEHRDNWRPDFYERFIKIAQKSSSVEEAVISLNSEVFKVLNIGFRKKKFRKSVFSPFKSMKKGFASCEGLAVLLADACRAVGIPARLMSTPRFVSRKDGHTWVEIYDNGIWRYIGAIDFSQLDFGWFSKYVIRADPSKPIHRIYAVSFEKTGLHVLFGPEVSLIDVTEKYIKQKVESN